MSDTPFRTGPINNAYLNSFLQEHTAVLKNILAAYVLRAGLATGSNVPLVAEEIFQDTMLQVMDLGKRFLAVQQPRTWFIRVALNVMQRRRATMAKRYRFEVLVSDEGTATSGRAVDADTVGLGEASGPATSDV